MSIFDEILKLSPIIQGALGSALFALILWLLRIIFNFLQKKTVTLNQNNQLKRLQSDLIRYTALESGNVSANTLALVGLLYFAFSDFIKAIICLCVGVLLSSLLPLFKEISFLFALYFLYLALDSVKTAKSEKDYSKKIAELTTEINKIKQQQQD